MGSILTRTASVFGLAGLMVGTGTLTISDLYAADFYADKKLTIIAGFRPGGGVDNNARIVGRHLGKHIPGNPSIINKNMPGAGGARLANWMYNKGKPDGLTIALPGRSWMFSKLFKDPGVRFEPLKFEYIGAPGPVNNKLWVRADLGIKSIDELKKARATPVVFGGLRSRSSNVVVPTILSRAGWSVRSLKGYKGTSKIMLALEQKEVDGIWASDSTLRNNRADLIDNKVIVPILQVRGWEKGVPLLYDQVGGRTKKLLNLVLAPSSFGIPVIAPPGTSKARMDTLRAAYAAMVRDKAFIADGAKRGVYAKKPLGGDAVKKVITDVINDSDASIVKEYLAYRGKKKKKKKKAN
jgi:tripartite-type tricarboxylate transporter receptor subunit TctC